MIYNSIVPEETMLRGWEETTYNFRDVRIAGIEMQVELLDRGRAKIVRLYSPDPAHYLNPEYAPGRIFDFGFDSMD